MPYYFDEDFEKLAQTIRIALGLDDQVRIDVIEFLRRLKHNGYIADYVRVPDTKMPHAEAEYNPDDRKIYLRESVYAGAAGWNDRARFTIIHEGAHALYDHQFRRKRSIAGNPITELRVSSIRRDEVHANKLAASILAPYHCAEFSLRTTDRDLMARFGLSAAAAAKRYDEMAGIFRRSKNLPRKLPPGVIDFLAARRREGYAVQHTAGRLGRGAGSTAYLHGRHLPRLRRLQDDTYWHAFEVRVR
jgi:Zn-dependent peptidase ImmA (M78 family)